LQGEDEGMHPGLEEEVNKRLLQLDGMQQSLVQTFAVVDHEQFTLTGPKDGARQEPWVY
jgi:hypothetical protein